MFTSFVVLLIRLQLINLIRQNTLLDYTCVYTGEAICTLCEEVRPTQVVQHYAGEQHAHVWPTVA